MKHQTIINLVDKYLAGSATPKEQQLVDHFLDGLKDSPVRTLTPEEEQAKEALLLQRIQTGLSQDTGKLLPLSRRWLKWTAAAAVLAIALTTVYFLTRTSQPQEIVTTERIIKDVPPGRDAAILTLADGRQVVLDSTTGTIINADGIQVINAGGLLTYEGETIAGEIVYNTITTAKGNQYQLLLEDGTKVWLNAASSLRYPVAFKGKDRTVELTGEGYFEVAKDKAKPFFVRTALQEIQVLGTHFNVNSYKDEETIKTTLIEGAVRVAYREKAVVLQPGEQAVSDQATISINKEVDVERVMAWKNGWFEFTSYDLESIMRQLSRWYDVEIIYKGKPTGEKFAGRISGKLPLSSVLHLLENSGVQFKLEGKRLIVQP